MKIKRELQCRRIATVHATVWYTPTTQRVSCYAGFLRSNLSDRGTEDVDLSLSVPSYSSPKGMESLDDRGE